MGSRKKKYDDDDGRVVASMNVDGMPTNMWSFFVPGYTVRGKHKQKNFESFREEEKEPLVLTKKETLSIWLNAVLAGLALSAVIGVVYFLFILFCTNVWLR